MSTRRCEWRDCDEDAEIGLRYGRLKIRGELTSLPAVVYCRPHAREVCGLFRVERWVNLAPKPKPKKPKPPDELDVLLVPDEPVPVGV